MMTGSYVENSDAVASISRLVGKDHVCVARKTPNKDDFQEQKEKFHEVYETSRPNTVTTPERITS